MKVNNPTIKAKNELFHKRVNQYLQREQKIQRNKDFSLYFNLEQYEYFNKIINESK